MKGYKEIPADRMPGNVIEMIGRQWMLVTAGSGEQCNTMTASWGGIGVIWGQPAATVYIRPQRYTREFVDAEPRLTLSFMGEEYRRALAYCGAHSGRTEEKIARAGLTVSIRRPERPASAVPKSCWSAARCTATGSDPRNFWRRS